MKNHYNWADEYELRLYRKGVETLNNQLESMGLSRLRARTNSPAQTAPVAILANVLYDLIDTLCYPN